MQTTKITLPTLHEGQIDIECACKRFNCIACGRRFGKTLFAALRLAVIPALKGYPVGWFAPNYKYLEEPWGLLRNTLKPITRRVNKTDRIIELVTGGSIEFWTLEDPDAGRSRKYKRVIVDEAGLVAALEERWNQAIRPTLMDLRGDAFLLGTPKGQNFFFTAFNYGQDPLNKEWMSWRKPSSVNPHLHPDEIEAARKDMPERAFRQEIEAEFLEDGGGVFRGVQAVIDKERPGNLPPTPGRLYTLGVDLAKVEDFTVLSVVDDMGRQVYLDRFNQISWERQIGAIAEVATKYKAQIIVDSTGVGDPIFERLRGLNFRVTGYTLTNQSKEQLIDNLAMLIEQTRVSLIDSQTQTAELLAYQYELTPSRNVKMNAPAGMHDDHVIALALSCWGLKQRPATQSAQRSSNRTFV